MISINTIVARGWQHSGTLEIIAAVLEPQVIKDIFMHLELQPLPPPKAPVPAAARTAGRDARCAARRRRRIRRRAGE